MEQTILLVSDNPDLCAAARREFDTKANPRRVSAVRSVDAARRIVEQSAPAVILLEDSSILPTAECPEKRLQLNSVVSALAVHAPVVVIGGREQQNEIAPLVASGAADFVERTEDCMELALERIEQRLKHTNGIAQSTQSVRDTGSEAGVATFGEVLRHELNNPLTGILGNAELLLAEVRRKNDGLMPRSGMQRLETIAALAVRLRETVRRLSQEWEARDHAPR
jgi:signal transduction histidine kinase